MAGLFQTRERRALVVFLLLAGVFVAGLLLAERRESAVSADRAEAEMEATVAADSVRLFEFDPNTVEYADLRRLGLSSRMAVSLLKYRAAGKVFRIPEDVATCYGMTDSVYFILEPYIRIGREYALTPSPRREYREYVPQEPRRIVPANDSGSIRCPHPTSRRSVFPSVRPRLLSVIGIFTKVFGTKRVFGLAI